MKDLIMSIKPDNMDTRELTKTMTVKRNLNSITVTRYYKLYNNSRSWAIEATEIVDDWDTAKIPKLIKECKEKIADRRPNVIPMHGMIYYA